LNICSEIFNWRIFEKH